MARTLDRNRQVALMARAGAGDPAGQDLGALGDVAAEFRDILVIDVLHFIDAESAYFLAALAAAASASFISLHTAFIPFAKSPDWLS